MPRQKPQLFYPVGLIDGFDATNSFAGACQRLENLVFDQANQGIVVARPGATLLVDFALDPFYAPLLPAAISVHLVVGTRIYGMIATSRSAGFEEPFCFDVSTNGFVVITGITPLNVPANAGTVGLWTPPTMALIGVQIIVTHPGFDGDVPNSRFFGVIDLTNPLAPAWSSQNTTVHPLSKVPVAVANYRNEAWYAVDNALIWSDTLAATVVTNATQVLIMGDTSVITALAPLPIGTAVQGVAQALIAFKGAGSSIWQITGDGNLSASLVAITLQQDEIASNIGCWAPRSVVATPEGLKFQGVDGIYIVNLVGQVVPLLPNSSTLQPDLQTPFIEASQAQASRAAAGYNQGVYRISLDTTIAGVAIFGADFWFDEHVRRWTGPHTTLAGYACAQTYADKVALCSNAHPGKLFFSEMQQHNTSSFTDDGVAYTCSCVTTLMPNQFDMQMHDVVESTIEIGRANAGSQYTITAQDELGTTLGQAVITISATGPLWGAVLWGLFSWQTGRLVSGIYTVPWTGPVVFQRMQVEIDSAASAGVALGTLSLRYQQLGYLNVNPV